ncbi:MAG: DUF1592 domain-containing protein, partial [Rhizobiaceae bacterium]
ISDDLNPGGPGGDGSRAGAGGTAAGGKAGSGQGGAAPTSSSTGSTKAPTSTSSLRMPRLGHGQWARTAQAFLKLPATPAVTLRTDGSINGAYETDERLRTVDSILMYDYRAAAEQLVDQLTGDAGLYGAFLADAGQGDTPTRLRQLVKTAWPRAFRRPLSSAEIERYATLGATSPEYLEAGDDDARLRAAVRTMVRIALLSPHFIYRVEFGDPAGDVVQEGVRLRPLTPTEYATRLSYVLFDSPPDDALLASRDQLTTDAGRAALVDGLLKDERATRTLLAFHQSHYLVNDSRSMPKDPNAFPGSDGLGQDASTEATMFLEDVVKKGGGLRDLLLSRDTFVNARLAALYDLPTDGVPADSFVPRVLPDARSGILSRVSWTGSLASLVERSSILRGVYLQRRILCGPLGSAPNNAEAVAKSRKPPANLHTNREFVAYKTSPAQCQGCHEQIINPLGFAFEQFNAVGRAVTTENGAPVDSSGTVMIDDQEVAFSSSRPLLEAIAQSRQAHVCYASNLASWVLGRPLSPSDRSVVVPIGARSRSDNLSSRAVLGELLTSLSFRSLVVEEP